MINHVWSFAPNQAEVTVSSTALTPWSVESSAPWLTAQKLNEQFVYLSVDEGNFPSTGYNGRPNSGSYTGYIKITSGPNTLTLPVTNNVGYGDSLDATYLAIDYPF